MVAHRVEMTLQQDGKLSLDNLPFQAGDVVEVIFLAASAHAELTNRYPLHGAAMHYDRPFEPVAEDE